MPGYLLLRSNKESGPFTLQELIALGLKPYDLVWVEGKSAAWRYPGEITELAAHAPVVEEQPYDRFYKKNNRQVDVREAVIAEENVKTVNIPSTEALTNIAMMQRPADKQIPDANSRRRVFVTLPAGLEVAGAPRSAIADYVEPAVETIVALNEIPILPKPETKTLKKSVPESVVLEEKYSMPLDDIKQLYVDNMLKQKTKKSARFKLGSSVVMFLAALAFFTLVIVVGTFVLEKNDKIGTLVRPDAQQIAFVPQEADEKEADNIHDAPTEKQTNKKQAIIPETKKDIPRGQEQPIKASQSSPIKLAVDNNKSGQESIDNKNIPVNTSIPSQNDEATIAGNTAPAAMPTVATPEKTGSELTNTTRNNPTKETVVPASASYPATPDPEKTGTKKKIKKLVVIDKVDYKAGLLGGIKSVSVSLSNHSNYKMDLVIVDVDYLKANDNTIKTERLYFKNLLPDAVLTLAAPTGQGSKVDCRITLISSKELDYLYATIN